MAWTKTEKRSVWVLQVEKLDVYLPEDGRHQRLIWEKEADNLREENDAWTICSRFKLNLKHRDIYVNMQM